MKMYKNLVKFGGKENVLVTINQEDTEEEVVVEKFTPQKVHHIHVIDRSGSMSSEICGLIEQVKDTLKIMSNGDIVSVVWFSSPGQYRTLVKGAKNSPELLKLLDTLKSTVGCTCFSDPIKEVKEIVNELYSLNSNISVTLFTDGEPCGCSWGSTEEERRTLALVQELSNKIIAFNTVGYSNYYNQKFLKDLAAASEFGIFTHSSKIDEYSSIFQNNFDRIVGGKIETVEINFGETVTGFYLNRKFTKMEKESIVLSRLDKHKNQFFLLSSSDFKFSYNGTEYNSKDLKESVAAPTIKNFLYSAAYNMYYANDRMASLLFLAELQDKALIDSHMGAFTFDEAAAHQKLLENAVFDTSSRLSDGLAPKNYIPPRDAFCVLDLLTMLGNNGAYYMPFHKEAQEYERIGKKSEEEVNYFKYSDGVVYSPFSEFVFNKDKANLSIRIKINGTVQLNPTEAKDTGLDSTINSHIYRVHTFIKNGMLNLKKCVALMPKSLFETINVKRKVCTLLDTDKAFVKTFSKENGEVYVIALVNLNKLPVINATYNDKASADALFDITMHQTRLEAFQKCLNYYWKQFEENATAAQKKVGLFEGKTAEQIAVLEKYGLDKNSTYSGVGRSVAKNEDCDFYESRSFEFAIKGMKTLPSVPDVIELNKQISSGFTVKLSKIMDVMIAAHDSLMQDTCDNEIKLDKAVVATRNYLTEEIRNVKRELFKIRASMCATKMAKILMGDSFSGFTVDAKNNYVFVKDGETLIMETKRTKEYFS